MSNPTQVRVGAEAACSWETVWEAGEAVGHQGLEGGPSPSPSPVCLEPRTSPQSLLTWSCALFQTDMDSDLVGDICDTNEDRCVSQCLCPAQSSAIALWSLERQGGVGWSPGGHGVAGSPHAQACSGWVYWVRASGGDGVPAMCLVALPSHLLLPPPVMGMGTRTPRTTVPKCPTAPSWTQTTTGWGMTVTMMTTTMASLTTLLLALTTAALFPTPTRRTQMVRAWPGLRTMWPRGLCQGNWTQLVQTWLLWQGLWLLG